MDLDLRTLRYFVAVAETLNFSKAAARLNMSQPPLSLAIRQLETQMGTRLFERNSRHVSLTAAGAMLYKEALFLLSHAGSLKNRLQHISDHGRLRIGFVGSMVYRGLPALLDQLRAGRKDINIELAESNSGDIVDKVAMGHVDLGFIHSNQVPAELQDQIIFTEPFVLCVHRDNPILKKPAPTLTDFSDQRFIFFPVMCRPFIMKFCCPCASALGSFPRRSTKRVTGSVS